MFALVVNRIYTKKGNHLLHFKPLFFQGFGKLIDDYPPKLLLYYFIKLKKR